MDAIEHRRILEEERTGQLLIGIDRPLARQFFTNTSHAAVQSEIGEPVHFQRFMVKGAFISGYLLAVTAIGVSIWAFGWWSLLIGPLALASWFMYLGGSSRGDSSIWFAVLLLVGAASVLFVGDLSLAAKLFFATLAAAFFLARLTYLIAVAFLRALVVRNWRAFDALDGTAVVAHRTS